MSGGKGEDGKPGLRCQLLAAAGSAASVFQSERRMFHRAAREHPPPIDRPSSGQHRLIDSVHVHPREVFRAAVIGVASAILLMHNHPSGDPTPSEADIKITRDLICAGQLLKVEVLDHVIVGENTPARPKAHASLRELGYFYQ